MQFFTNLNKKPLIQNNFVPENNLVNEFESNEKLLSYKSNEYKLTNLSNIRKDIHKSSKNLTKSIYKMNTLNRYESNNKYESEDYFSLDDEEYLNNLETNRSKMVQTFNQRKDFSLDICDSVKTKINHILSSKSKMTINRLEKKLSQIKFSSRSNEFEILNNHINYSANNNSEKLIHNSSEKKKSSFNIIEKKYINDLFKKNSIFLINQDYSTSRRYKLENSQFKLIQKENESDNLKNGIYKSSQQYFNRNEKNEKTIDQSKSITYLTTNINNDEIFLSISYSKRNLNNENSRKESSKDLINIKENNNVNKIEENLTLQENYINTYSTEDNKETIKSGKDDTIRNEKNGIHSISTFPKTIKFSNYDTLTKSEFNKIATINTSQLITKTDSDSKKLRVSNIISEFETPEEKVGYKKLGKIKIDKNISNTKISLKKFNKNLNLLTQKEIENLKSIKLNK